MNITDVEAILKNIAGLWIEDEEIYSFNGYIFFKIVVNYNNYKKIGWTYITLSAWDLAPVMNNLRYLSFIDALNKLGLMKGFEFIQDDLPSVELLSNDISYGINCEKCSKPIQPYMTGNVRLNPDKIAELTKVKYGKALCSVCSQKEYSRRLRVKE